jgi:hypothetical protein
MNSRLESMYLATANAKTKQEVIDFNTANEDKDALF